MRLRDCFAEESSGRLRRPCRLPGLVMTWNRRPVSGNERANISSHTRNTSASLIMMVAYESAARRSATCMGTARRV